MTLYKRGGFWWWEFQFRGMRIRESSDSRNKEVARTRERERRSGLEAGKTKPKRQAPLTFARAAEEWLELNQAHWSKSNRRIERYNVDQLLRFFGTKKMLAAITADDIARYQTERVKDGVSNRTVNMAVGSLRAVMRKNRMWSDLSADVKTLKTRSDIGKALSADEETRLLAACKKSRSRSLYVAVLISLHTGLRNAELRLLKWRQIDLAEGRLTVGNSKTAGGEGRIIPLSATALECLQAWRSQFPEAEPEHYAFPSEKYGSVPLPGTGILTNQCMPYDIRPDVPIGSWKVAWTIARKNAKVRARWHDLRHSFVSRLAESQASDATMMAMSGHLSRKMLERYSHTRYEAKQTAIAVLDTPRLPTKIPTPRPIVQ